LEPVVDNMSDSEEVIFMDRKRGDSESDNEMMEGERAESEYENRMDRTLEDKFGKFAAIIQDSLLTMKTQVDESVKSIDNKLQTIQSQVDDRVTRDCNNSGEYEIRRRETEIECLGDQEISNRIPTRGTPSAGVFRGPTLNNVHQMSNMGHKIKPHKYDGSDDLDEYLTHFNIVAELNNWDYHTKSLFLASSLQGSCLSLLSDLNAEQRRDFDCLVETLQNRYGSVNRAEIFRSKLQCKTQGRSETIPELAQAIRKLTRKAYPGAKSEVVELLALDYFIDALPEADTRLRLREVGPKSVSEAERIAVRLEAHKVADRTRGRFQVRTMDPSQNRTSGEAGQLESMGIQMRNLTDEVRRLKMGREEQGPNRRENNYYRPVQEWRREGPAGRPFNNGYRNQNGTNNRNNFRGNNQQENYEGSNPRAGGRPVHNGPEPLNQRQ